METIESETVWEQTTCKQFGNSMGTIVNKQYGNYRLRNKQYGNYRFRNKQYGN